jgi:hypothetical protein
VPRLLSRAVDEARRTALPRLALCPGLERQDVARHRSPRGRRPTQLLPPMHSHGSGSAGRQRPTRTLLLNQAAAATTAATVATVGTLLVESQVDDVPTQHESVLAASAAASENAIGEVERLRSSVALVAQDPEPFDAAALVKAVGLAEARAEEEARRQKAEEEQARCRFGFGPVKPWVAQVGGLLRCEFDIATVGGVARRSTASDHPRGLALDFRADRARGDALARCALDNMRAFSIKYVIWQQRIDYGSGWEPMEDRGSPTANHMGHVHISFEARPRGGTTLPSC